MIKRPFVCVLLGILSIGSVAFAGEAVVLTPGQSYNSGEKTVICTDGRSTRPIAVTECQYWDEFNKKCLYEATRYVMQGMQCLEDCQHWDSFFKRCDYAVTCKYQPDQGVFVKTSCADFDDFNKKCLRQRQKIIGLDGSEGRNRHERPLNGKVAAPAATWQRLRNTPLPRVILLRLRCSLSN